MADKELSARAVVVGVLGLLVVVLVLLVVNPAMLRGGLNVNRAVIAPRSISELSDSNSAPSPEEGGIVAFENILRISKTAVDCDARIASLGEFDVDLIWIWPANQDGFKLDVKFPEGWDTAAEPNRELLFVNDADPGYKAAISLGSESIEAFPAYVPGEYCQYECVGSALLEPIFLWRMLGGEEIGYAEVLEAMHLSVLHQSLERVLTQYSVEEIQRNEEEDKYRVILQEGTEKWAVSLSIPAQLAGDKQYSTVPLLGQSDESASENYISWAKLDELLGN